MVFLMIPRGASLIKRTRNSLFICFFLLLHFETGQSPSAAAMKDDPEIKAALQIVDEIITRRHSVAEI
ncbi:hypothetical protein L0156_02055 [bacterium]|nr:hypothetical protein [bacterium]